jgi:pilus assembly protein Flp/PilA
MAKFITASKQFVKGEEGATMVEYALMVALVAVACIITIGTMTTSLKSTFTTISTSLSSAS